MPAALPLPACLPVPAKKNPATVRLLLLLRISKTDFTSLPSPPSHGKTFKHTFFFFFGIPFLQLSQTQNSSPAVMTEANGAKKRTRENADEVLVVNIFCF